jgi:hypothetical protein
MGMNTGGLVIGGAGFAHLSVPPNELDAARSALIRDWQRHHYCLSVNVGTDQWRQFGASQEYPGISSDPISAELESARAKYMSKMNRKMDMAMRRRHGKDWLKPMMNGETMR